MHFTPWRSSGVILLFALATGWPSTPSIIGMFGPVMSASSSPTDAPDWASATARLTLTVLLPTPPLPGRDGDDVLHARQELLWLLRRRPPDHRAPGDLDLLDPDLAQRRVHVALDLVLERAGRRRQLDREGDIGAVDRDVLDHVQRDDVAPELGLLDVAEGVEDGAFGEGGHRLWQPR